MSFMAIQSSSGPRDGITQVAVGLGATMTNGLRAVPGIEGARREYRKAQIQTTA